MCKRCINLLNYIYLYYSIQKQHAVVNSKGMTVTLEPLSGAKILVNGQKITKGVQLHHNDR